MPFSKLGLSDRLVQGILATGYTAPTAIQSQAIPLAIAGKDIIGCAQTGTGKTAAFVLPILQHLEKELVSKTHHHCRALVVTPTRELSLQVEEFIRNYARFTKLRALAVYGGSSMENQITKLKQGVDIVIATPGRLLDHLERRTINLSHIEILVLDEADRMFDMGFIHDVRRIVKAVPEKRQTLLFSATMSKEVRDLASSILKHPAEIEIGERRKPVESVRQVFYAVRQDLKGTLLLHILKNEQMDSVLVFTRTKRGADKIALRLERAGLKSAALHANRTQSQRLRALEGFKKGKYTVLVATDIAARGIDVEGISHVVNLDTPTYAEDYIHRIGRTGRASLTGDAITLVSREEEKYLDSIERFIGKRFDVRFYPGFDNNAPAPVQSHAPRGQRPQHGGRHHRAQQTRHGQKNISAESETGDSKKPQGVRSGFRKSGRRKRLL